MQTRFCSDTFPVPAVLVTVAVVGRAVPPLSLIFALARGSVKLLADAVGDAVNLAVLRHEFRLVDVVACVIGKRRRIDELHRAAVDGVCQISANGGCARFINALDGSGRLCV